MPAKRCLLPRPCPICGKNNGTMQVVLFSSDWKNITCRIGHYDAEAYRKIKNVHKNLMLEPTTNDLHFKQDIRKKQRSWCSFRIDRDFAASNIYRLEEVMAYLENGSRYQNFRKSFTCRGLSRLKDAIRKKGWHRLPNYSARYRGRSLIQTN